MMTIESIRERFVHDLRHGWFVQDKTGVKTLEVINATFEAHEPAIFGTLNVDYAARELEWYQSQSLYVKDIPGKVPAIWEKIASKSGQINSNYGWCISSEENWYQYDHVLKTLINDPNSRRALMIYTRPSMQADYCKDGMSDFMCTSTVQYLIRRGILETIVTMRSNDAFFGYRNDVHFQKYVRDALLGDYNSLSSSRVLPGPIYWNVGSLHVYESCFWMVDGYAKTGNPDMTKEEYRSLFSDSMYLLTNK